MAASEPGTRFETRGVSTMRTMLATPTAAAGHEAILVSHQLPIVMVQRTVLGQRLPHAPWNRECDLASVTSLLFDDNQVTDIFYSSPAQEI